VALEITDLTAVLAAAFTGITALITARPAFNDALVVCAEEIIDHVHGVVAPMAPVAASAPASVPAATAAAVSVASVPVPEAAEEALALFFFHVVAAIAMVAAQASAIATTRHLFGDFAVSDLDVDVGGG
jgi:hypothetical protein